MEKSDHDEILPNMDIASSRLTKKKALTEELPTGNDHDDTESNSESDSDSEDSDSEYECTVCNKTFSGYIPLKQHEKGSKHKKVLARKKKEKKLLNIDVEDDEEEEDKDYLIPEPFQVCKVCNKQFSGPESYLMHLKSKAHKHKVLLASILEQVKDNGEINVNKLRDICNSKKSSQQKAAVSVKDEEDYDEFDTGEYECKGCEKSFSGLIPFTQHLMSKSHAKQVERKKLLHKIVPEPTTSAKTSDQTIVSDANTLNLEDDILVCKACSTSFSGPESAMMHLKSRKHAKKIDKYIRKLEKKKNKAVTKPKESDSESNEDEVDSQLESKQDEKLEGEYDPEEPQVCDSSSSEEADDISASSGNVQENIMHSKYDQYKKAMTDLRQEHEVEK